MKNLSHIEMFQNLNAEKKVSKTSVIGHCRFYTRTENDTSIPQCMWKSREMSRNELLKVKCILITAADGNGLENKMWLHSGAEKLVNGSFSK